jgi:hypothetical protein
LSFPVEGKESPKASRLIANLAKTSAAKLLFANGLIGGAGFPAKIAEVGDEPRKLIRFAYMQSLKPLPIQLRTNHLNEARRLNPH